MKIIITDTGMYPGKISNEDRVFRLNSGIEPCDQCNRCWYMTPGVCCKEDEAKHLGALLGKCNEVVIVSKYAYGSFSPFVKMMMERCKAYLVPMRKEGNHQTRYDNSIKLTVHFYGEYITKEDQQQASKLVELTAQYFSMKEHQIHWYRDPWDMRGDRI